MQKHQNIRGAKRRASSEISKINRLEWANETPGIDITTCTCLQCCLLLVQYNFRRLPLLWECLKVIFDCYWGKSTRHGSLVSSLRELINRNRVDKKVKKTFCIGDEFLTHVFQAHLLAQCYKHFNISSTKGSIPHHFTRQWLQDTGKAIVEKGLLPPETPTNQQSFMYVSFLYLDLNLFVWKKVRTQYDSGACGYRTFLELIERITLVRLPI